MSRIWSMMDVGKRSMMNSQTSLQTTSHNIANKNTEGYSRQRVDIQANEPIGMGKLRIGSGARATSITRTNNQFVEKQIEKEGNSLGKKTAESEMLSRVEQVFNEQMNKGLNKFVGEFFNAFRELSNTPENLALRTTVRDAANFMSKDMHRVHKQLKDIQAEGDFQMASEVASINSITKEIAGLNDKIVMAEMNSIEANDERDRRDHLIKELSGKINIRSGESEDGILTITAGNTAILVSGSSQRDLIAAATPGRNGKRDGNFDVLYKPNDTSAAVNVSDQITSGTLGGLISIRDKFINPVIEDMNTLAFTIAKEVNAIHTSGFTRYNQKGESFFTFSDKDKMDYSASIQVNDAIMGDVGKVAAAAQPNSPGDNRIANMISSLQYEPILGNGKSTTDDFYSSLVGRVGIAANRANSEAESQKDIVGQLKNIRESISGVSLDEETAKMIEFQKNFDASARLIRTADQMMETVLNLKPM